MKRTIIAATAALIALAPPANAVPQSGTGGLCANASALAQYIANNYPGVLGIGGVRADRLPDHPSGHAIDVMVGGNSSLGYTINSDILGQRGRFGVKYTLWMVPNHHDHVHITVF